MQYISMACTLDYVELTEKLVLLQAQVKEEHANFDKFWSEHKTLLDRVMNFSLFDRQVTKVIHIHGLYENTICICIHGPLIKVNCLILCHSNMGTRYLCICLSECQI